MITVGKLSKMFGFSRSTLLYYDKIGLIRPSSRSESGYQIYNENDIYKLEQMIVLRNAGVPLRQISSLLSAYEPKVFGQLLKRLGELNSEIERLKEQQNYIIHIFEERSTATIKNNKNVIQIDEIANYAGISPEKREEWHDEFARQSPEEHEHLLSVFGLDKLR